jgi:ubiquinone/menaquinone biosynthesis C-methylase UbiE
MIESTAMKGRQVYMNTSHTSHIVLKCACHFSRRRAVSENDQIANVFNIVAEGYDREALRQFPFAAERMLMMLKPRPGWHLLDIATGTGQVAISAAQRIKPDGRVQGIDVSRGMLDVAFNNVQRSGLRNIDLHEMDACQPEFSSDFFDAVTCGFGLFFLPDMQAALQNWLPVMKPAAPVIISTFAEDAFKPLIEQFVDDIKRYVPDFDTTNMAALTTVDECESLFAAAGYDNFVSEQVNLGYHLRNADEWWEVVWNTALRGSILALSADKLASFRAEHLRAIEQYQTDEGLWMNVNVILAMAHKPAVKLGPE